MYFKKVFLSTLARLTRNLLLIIDTLGERSIFVRIRAELEPRPLDHVKLVSRKK